MKAISDAAFALLVEKMEMYGHLSVRGKRLLRPMLFEMVCSKGSRILNFGQRQEVVWFMLEGLAREISVDKHSFRETTVWFWFPFSFLFTTPGFFSRQPSLSTIEVLQDSWMVLLSYENWQGLKRVFAEAEQVTEMIRDADVKLRLAHEKQFRSLSTLERYQQNSKLLDQLFGLTKRRFIAEFMRMSVDRIGKLRVKCRKPHSS